MTVDTAATSSPEPFPGHAESDARLSRLHDALKQLRAKSAATIPLSSIAPGAAPAPVATEESLPPPPPETTSFEVATGLAEIAEEPAPSELQTTAACETEPEPPPALPLPPREAALPPAALIAAASEEPPLAPVIAAVEPQPTAKSFSLETWFSNVALRQYRQLAGNLASQFPSGEPTAIAIAALSCRHEALTIASRLALCLAERQAGEVLLIEPAERRLQASSEARRASLIDVVAGRADWSDAVAPAAMAGLSLIEFGWPESPNDALLPDQWRRAAADLKRRFGYAVSVVRPGESSASDAWLGAIDGVYLAVGLGNASRSTVAARQTQLKACGARLLGCIALK